MKIIIIGAGISGLSTAISLRKYLQPQISSNDNLEIQVYDEARLKPAGEVDYSWHDHSDIRQNQNKNEKKNQGAAISLQ